MAAHNLSAVLKAHGNAVKLLRNSKIGMYVYPVVAPEFSNWRNEQVAWRKSAVLFDQTHHMDELIVEGPDAAAFLEYVGINSFANFDLNRAKHFVPVTPAGHVIGDMIIFREREDKFVLVGRAPTANWVRFQQAIGKWKVRLTHDPRSDSRPDGKAIYRTHYRFQIQGPEANKIFDKINGGPVPDVKFFHVDWIKIGSRRVQALRHGMAGAPGLEVWGPYADKHYIQSTILQAARDVGVDLHLVGSRAYSTNTLESGWIPSPLPGIYTGGGMLQEYRDWLGADSYEAVGSIGGSLATDNIEDYYVNPFELGYGFYIGWKTDFIGKDALTKMKDQKNRKKVTLEWNRDDLLEGRRFGLRGRRAVQVDRLPAAELRLDERGRAAERQEAGRHLDVQRLLVQRALHAVARRRQRRRARWRSADADLGRAANDRQDLDRTAPAGRDPRPRFADAVCARSARKLRRQLAHEGRVSSVPQVALRRLLL